MSPTALERLRDLDRRATARLRSRSARGIAHAALAILSHSADSAVLIPGMALLWWADRFSRRSLAVPLAAAYLVSVPLTALVKYAVRRRRPAGEWGAVYRKMDPHSFPSGHASRTAAMAMVVLARDLAVAGSLLAAWSIAVGLTRIILGVHFLLDVAAGWLLGLAVGVALWFWIAKGMPGLPPLPWVP